MGRSPNETSDIIDYGTTNRNNAKAQVKRLPDDMPAHAKSTLSGVSLTIPITNGHLNLGTWQGIYFCEYRNYGGARELVITIIGE